MNTHNIQSELESLQKVVVEVFDKLRNLRDNSQVNGSKEPHIHEKKVRKSMTYQIKDGVPLPGIKEYTSGGISKYPLDQLQVGQMFEIPTGYKPASKVRQAVYAAVKKHAARNPNSGRKFATRVMNDKLVGVWRTK